MSAPYSWQAINSVTWAVSPSTLHTRNNELFSFFRKYLIQKVLSVFKFKLPDNWAENYFLYTLFLEGYIAIINTDKFGVIPQNCGLQGYNVMYQPTHAVIANPLLTGILTPVIDKQCALIKLMPDYSGVSDIVNYYADNMAMSAEALEMNIMNSKLSYLFAAKNKQGAESMKKIFDQLQRGELGVFYDDKLRRKSGNGDTETPWEVFNQDLRNSFIAPELMDCMRRWEELFCNEIGIGNVRSDKKERMIVAEAESNNEESRSKAELWLETLKEGCEKANQLFGIEMEVEFRSEHVNNDYKPTNSGQQPV